MAGMSDLSGPEHTLRPSAEAALDAWSELVAANREQIERLRESTPSADFYRPRAQQFRPGRVVADDLDWVLEHARPEDTWLDIGAGGGRIAVPVAERVTAVHAVEPSEAMREVMGAASESAGLENLTVHDQRWPPEDGVDIPISDVSVASHVLYDQQDLRAFLRAMEAHTRRTCIVVIGDRAPSGAFEPLWSELYGEAPRLLPGRRELLAVLGALDRPFEVRTLPRTAREPVSEEEAYQWARWLYWLEPGSERDQRAQALVTEHFRTDDGMYALPSRISYVSVVSWPSPTE
jgi:SAM-dependent methyltransferase